MILDAAQRFYALAVGIVGILGFLGRILYRLGRFAERLEQVVKNNDDDHKRYDGHLATPHARR